MDRAGKQERIKELRLRARHYREAAQHADSYAAYQEELQAASRADAEANELEATLEDRREATHD